jgi:hypothetical protein
MMIDCTVYRTERVEDRHIYRKKSSQSLRANQQENTLRESTNQKALNRTRGSWGNSFRTKPEDGGEIVSVPSPRLAGK